MQYDSLTEMWLEAGKYLLTDGMRTGSRAGETLEMLDYDVTLKNIEHNFVLNPVRATDPAYASAEFLWYMSGSSKIEMLLPYAPSYARFAEDDGRAWGAYGPRIQGNLSKVIECLKKYPDTRQAVLPIWGFTDPSVTNVVKDVPCTLSLQFLLREGKLNLRVSMRSNDVWLGMPYDVFCFTMLQRMVADYLNVRYGDYYHSVGSLHLYAKDFDKMEEALHCSPHIFSFMPTSPPRHGWDKMKKEDVTTTLLAEEKLRKTHACIDGIQASSCAMNDLFICCYNKLSNARVPCHSGILEAAQRIKQNKQQESSC